MLPLRSDDQIAIRCDISAGKPATVLWLDTAGLLRQLAPDRALVERLDRLTYPGVNKWMPLGSPGGTEMLFFCRGVPPPDEKLKDCFTIGQSPPQLPPANYLTLRRDRVAVGGPLDPESTEAKSVAAAQATVEQINERLRRYFDGVTGLAFSHPDSDGEENDRD